MFVDSHCHIFNRKILENVRARPAMLAELGLNTDDAEPRLDPIALQRSAEENGVDICVLLPSAGPDKVRSENDRFVGFTREFSRLRTLGTLHPAMDGLEDEIRRMLDLGIKGFKFSTFSQEFDPASTETAVMLRELERIARERDLRPVALFDTFATARVHFGAQPDHVTTPAKLAGLVHRFRGIDFIGAHMGGLSADFHEIRSALIPADNLYLDTANAAHTLSRDEFVELLGLHGPRHILFGTDWPWFLHSEEKGKIASLLHDAGYDEEDCTAVFGGNAVRLLGL